MSRAPKGQAGKTAKLSGKKDSVALKLWKARYQKFHLAPMGQAL